MGVLLIIVLIGVVFFQARKIEKLEAKIFRLTKELLNYKNDLVKQNKSTTDVINEMKNDAEVIDKKINTKIDSTTSKNLSILITGSILIVLSAIVFLTTAWQSIPDFIKTVVLFLVAFVFLGASKISKEKYNLEKASKTFFYIGMAYLPICFLSISIFGLFGTYLSANGEGRYIYLGLSTLIISILYYFISKKTEDRYLFYGSLLSQVFSVILFTLMFEERIYLVCVNLLLYNLLLMILMKDKAFQLVTIILPGIISFVILCEIGDDSWYYIFASLLLAINFCYLELKNKNIVKAILFNIFLFIFGFSLIFKRSFGLSDATCQVFATLFTCAIFIIENLVLSGLENNKNLLTSSRVVTIIAMIYLYIDSLSGSKLAISSYVMAILFEIILIYDFIKTKHIFYKYFSYVFMNILLIDIHNNFFNDFELVRFIPMLTTTGIIVMELLSVQKRDNFLQTYLLIFEAISLISISGAEAEVKAILAVLFTVFVLYYNNKTGTRSLANIVPLLCSLICIVDTGLNEQFEFGIMLLATIGLTYMSVKSGQINAYTVVSGIYLSITTNRIESIYFSELLYIVWGAMHIYLYQDEKYKDIFKALTAFFATMLYYSIVEDLRLDEFTLFEMLGIVICGIYVIRNVIAKYNKNIDIFEYIFWTIVYFNALVSYTNSRDGILFSILILSVIFYSYYKKYGATFIAGIMAILINAFALTKEFWFSIPWWIYLLVVGGILIGFAIKNEANENKEKITVGSVIRGIKDKVEKE